jgi:hypothetical protein
VLSTVKTLRTMALKEALGAELQEASAADLLIKIAEHSVLPLLRPARAPI